MPTTPDNPRFFHRSNGLPLETQEYGEAAGQTYKRGDLVKLVAGLITLCKAYGNSFGAADDPIGIAGADATGVTSTLQPVGIFTTDTRLILPVCGAAGASAVTALANLGTAYELYVNASGVLMLNNAATTNTKVVAEQINLQYPVGEAYGWYTCKWIGAEAQLGV